MRADAAGVKLLLRAALLMLALPPSGAAIAPQAVRAVSASYDVFRNGWQVAVVNETFEITGDTYRIVSESRAVGLLALFETRPVRLVSTGLITASGLRPRQFEGKRSDDDRRRVRAEFDWQAERLTFTHDGRTETAQLIAGAQDRLSFLYQFMFVEFDRLRSLEFAMTNGRKFGHYRYLIHPDVEIITALGPITALHLDRKSTRLNSSHSRASRMPSSA